ncbi:hypothetical protein HMPREF2944_06090 [Rothia sp. HMSC072E10]|nr:hypothetical protein HMPREF2944_06090 [Rothia sp. HMSC072E10]
MGPVREFKGFIFPAVQTVVVQLVAHRHYTVTAVPLQTISAWVTCSRRAVKNLIILAIEAKDIVRGTGQHGWLSAAGATDTVTAALTPFNS